MRLIHVGSGVSCSLNGKVFKHRRKRKVCFLLRIYFVLPFGSTHGFHVMWEARSLWGAVRFRESASLFLPLYDCGLAQSVNVPTLPRLLRPWVPPFLSKQRGPGSSQAFSDKSHVGRQYALTALLELSPSGDGHRTLNLRPQRHPRVLSGLVLKGRATCMRGLFLFLFLPSGLRSVQRFGLLKFGGSEWVS